MSSNPSNLVEFVGNNDELKNLISNYKSLCVVDFFANYCPPCKNLLKVLPQLAESHPNVIFIKVDVEKNEEVSDIYSVSSIPHIKFMKGNENNIDILGVVLGYAPDKIRNKIAELI